VSAIVCSFHRWFRYAFAAEADIYKCSKCGVLIERPAGSEAPPAAAKARA